MSPMALPICLGCKHLLPYEDQKNACRAFPEGIPLKVLIGEASHLRPYPGDHGIQFEPKPGYDAQGRRVSR